MFALWNFIICLVLVVLMSLAGIISNTLATVMSVIEFLYILAVLLPSLGVFVRRMHDTGRSGWWFFIGLIPVIGEIVLLVFLVQDGKPGDNKYGPNPKGIQAAA